MQQYGQENIPVWGTIPERVSITAGPNGPLAADGLESYKKVWRKILAAARS
jgi:chromosome partitioning protein